MKNQQLKLRNSNGYAAVVPMRLKFRFSFSTFWQRCSFTAAL